MKKQYIVIAIIVIVVLAALVAMFLVKGEKSSDTSTVASSETLTVASSDGTMEIAIPKGALPEAVNPEDVAIVNISDESSVKSEGSEDELVMSAYALEPNGLIFNKPVAFSFTHTPEENDVFLPTALHISDKSFAFVNDTSVVYNEDETVTLSGTINHFSELLLIKPPYDIRFKGGGESYDVGETFTYGLNIFKDDIYLGSDDKIYAKYFFDILTRSNKNRDWYTEIAKITDEEWEIKAFKVQLENSNTITPSFVDMPGKVMKQFDKYPGEFELTCVKAGGNRVLLPDGIELTFIASSRNAISAISQYEISGSGGDKQYRLTADLFFYKGNTFFSVGCKDVPKRPKVTAPNTEFEIRLEGGIFE